jgi:hypothetical protein
VAAQTARQTQVPLEPADEIAMALNTRPKFVASRTLDKVDWNNSTLLKGRRTTELDWCRPARLRARGLPQVRRGRDWSGDRDLRFRLR